MPQGGKIRRGKKGCGTVGAQAGRTIWLYEGWWKSSSLRSARGIQPEKRTDNKILDALADAFMQTQEGTLLHEVRMLHLDTCLDANQSLQVVHLASMGQMKQLLSVVYPQKRLPPVLKCGEDVISDTVFHEYANAKNLVHLVSTFR